MTDFWAVNSISCVVGEFRYLGSLNTHIDKFRFKVVHCIGSAWILSTVGTFTQPSHVIHRTAIHLFIQQIFSYLQFLFTWQILVNLIDAYSSIDLTNNYIFHWTFVKFLPYVRYGDGPAWQLHCSHHEPINFRKVILVFMSPSGEGHNFCLDYAMWSHNLYEEEEWEWVLI